MDFAAFTGTPRGMPMVFARCYTGTDGQSHFEDLDLLPPDMEKSIEQAASSITFTRSPNGRFSDWHNAPRRQYAIFLSGGQMEVVIGDGTTRRFELSESRCGAPREAHQLADRIDATDATAHAVFARALWMSGRHAENLVEADLAVSLDSARSSAKRS